MLGALVGDGDGMRNYGVWAALGQPYGFMFPQHINVSLCQIHYAPKCSLRGTYPISQLKLDH